jgi:hypothetical protein
VVKVLKAVEQTLEDASCSFAPRWLRSRLCLRLRQLTLSLIEHA